MKSLVLCAGALLGLVACQNSYRVTVKSIEFENEIDDSGGNEIEVYLFDARTHQMLGCAGSRHGLRAVDDSNVHYEVSATMTRADKDGEDIDIDDVPIVFEVWEDDDDPVCPVIPSPTGNEFMGSSPAMTPGEWLQQDAEIGFGQILSFSVQFEPT